LFAHSEGIIVQEVVNGIVVMYNNYILTCRHIKDKHCYL